MHQKQSKSGYLRSILQRGNHSPTSLNWEFLTPWCSGAARPSDHRETLCSQCLSAVSPPSCPNGDVQENKFMPTEITIDSAFAVTEFAAWLEFAVAEALHLTLMTVLCASPTPSRFFFFWSCSHCRKLS